MEQLRGPSPDDPEERLNALTKLIAEAAARATVNVKYQEGSSSIERMLLKWLLGGVGTLVLAFITEAIVVYGSFHDLQSTFTTWKEDVERRLERLENSTDGRTGVPRTGSHAGTP